MSKPVRWMLCIVFIIVAAACMLTTVVSSKPEIREYTETATMGTEINRSFQVLHDLENCEYGDAERTGDNFPKYGLQLLVREDGFDVVGIPTATGTAVATAYYKENSTTIYARITVEIYGTQETIEYSVIGATGEPVEAAFVVPHGFEHCTFQELTEDGCDYAAYQLTFTVRENEIQLSGTPEKAGATQARAVFEADGCSVEVVVSIVIEETVEYLSYDLGLAVGEYAEETIPIPHGLQDCTFGEAVNEKNTYSIYGLTMSVQEDSITIAGKPSMEGDAACTAVYQAGGVSVYAEIHVHMTEGGIVNIRRFTAIAGEPFLQILDYADIGIDPTHFEIHETTEYPDTLQDFNLTAALDETTLTIEGTPLQTGTAAITVQYSDESSVNYLTVEIDIIVPDKQTLSVDGVVGKELDVHLALENGPFEVEEAVGLISTSTDYALTVTCDGTEIQVKGTPTQEGRCFAYFNLVADDELSHLTVEINVAPAADTITLTSRSSDGNVTLDADIPLKGSYHYTLYRYPAYVSATEVSIAKGYDNREASESHQTIGLNFNRLTKAAYFFYITATQGDNTLNSNTLRVLNPDYTVEIGSNPFTDVTEDAWYREGVLYALECGLINGKTTSTFVPDSGLLVCEAIKLAACLNEYYKNGFVTLESSEDGVWYSSYIKYASQCGIISERQFLGHYCDTITRGEFAELFAAALPQYNYNEIRTIEDGAITDVSATANYADAVYQLYRAGILTDTTETGEFQPESDIARNEAVVIISRIIDASARIAD